METLFPNADHRFCVRYLYSNFSTQFKEKFLKDSLWSAARSSYIEEWEKYMTIIVEINKEAYNWVKKLSPRCWTRSYFSEFPKCGMLLNNCVCFNKFILDAKGKSILTLVEMIRCKLMRRICKKREEIKKLKGPICPKIQKKLEKIKTESATCWPIASGGPMFQIGAPNGQFVVDIEKYTCSCRKWQLSGIPCSHACSTIFHNLDQPEKFVHECYSIETYKHIYSEVIKPINGQLMWPKTRHPKVMPPTVHKQPGRPKKKEREKPMK